VSLRHVEPRHVQPRGAGEAGGRVTPRALVADQPDRRPAAVALRCPWGQLVTVPADGLLIGQGSPAFHELRDYPRVSRRHARLWWRDDQLLVDDCDSPTSTFVDGQRVVPGRPVAVRPGQRLSLGHDIDIDIVELDERGQPRTLRRR